MCPGHCFDIVKYWKQRLKNVSYDRKISQALGGGGGGGGGGGVCVCVCVCGGGGGGGGGGGILKVNQNFLGTTPNDRLFFITKQHVMS